MMDQISAEAWLTQEADDLLEEGSFGLYRFIWGLNGTSYGLSQGEARDLSRQVARRILDARRAQSSWGYRRLHGELLVLGVKVAASTVWEIPQEAGIDPTPEPATTTWADFLRSQADAPLACDFLETVTLSRARMYVLAVIEHASRRIRILGATPHPTTPWVVQAAKNLVMDLEDAGCRAQYMIRDRDGKYPRLFDSILADCGIEVVPSGIQMPRINSIMERWVQIGWTLDGVALSPRG